MADIRADKVPEEFFQRLKCAFAERKTNMRAATIQALGTWLGTPIVVATMKPVQYPKETQRLHDTLDRILDSGHDVAISAVTESLIASDRLVSIDKRPGKKYRGAQSRPEERKLG